MEYASCLPRASRSTDCRVVITTQMGRYMTEGITQRRRLFCIAGLSIISCLSSVAACASTYYVIVAGIGGEPDYEQRFAAEAKDLEKTFKASGPNSRVYTLTGQDATAARLRETLSSVVRLSKMDDDFALIMIGHGSFDGTIY